MIEHDKNSAGYFPLFVDLQGKKILIVGAGKIAVRRAAVLAEFGAQVTMVAPERGSEKWPEDARPGLLIWKQHAFGTQDIKDLEQSFFVITATDNPAVNDQVVQLCRERGIPVNHAGDQSKCDFQFPAIVRKDPVVIGVNAGGKDHGLVKRMAVRLREWIFGEEMFFG